MFQPIFVTCGTCTLCYEAERAGGPHRVPAAGAGGGWALNEAAWVGG